MINPNLQKNGEDIAIINTYYLRPMDYLESDELSTDDSSNSLTVEQAIRNLRGDDYSLRYYAAWWLGRFRVKETAAIDALIAALEEDTTQTETKDSSLQRNAARALGKLQDKRAVPSLIHCLNNDDFYVREAACQALEMIGDSSCIPALMQLLEGGVEAAVRVPGKPHLVQPYEAIIEALGSLHALDAIAVIKPFLEHFVERIQYASARALYQLTGDRIYGEILVDALRGKDLQLRRSALIDLGAIGYLPSAKAISETLAENSIKLIALKGLLEYDLTRKNSLSLSEDSIQVMTLMDSLL